MRIDSVQKSTVRIRTLIGYHSLPLIADEATALYPTRMKSDDEYDVLSRSEADEEAEETSTHRLPHPLPPRCRRAVPKAIARPVPQAGHKNRPKTSTENVAPSFLPQHQIDHMAAADVRHVVQPRLSQYVIIETN